MPILVPNASKEQAKRFDRGYIGGSHVRAGRPSLYEIVALSYIPQTAKLFQRNEFHLVTAKVFPLESFAVYGINIMNVAFDIQKLEPLKVCLSTVHLFMQTLISSLQEKKLYGKLDTSLKAST